MDNIELNKVREYFSAVAEAEAAVGEFYALCHEYWPDEELWPKIAAEEAVHAGAVRKMLELVAKSPDSFAVLKPLSPTPVRLFIEGVKANAAKVRGMVYNKTNAMAVSRDLEQSIIESRYDQLLACADPAYKALAGGLTADSRVHKEKFSARLATLGIAK